MVRGEQRPYPIQILVNYWELSQNQMGPLLDRLFQNGISVVTSFVPWHVFESDISHLLQKFLVVASERKIQVNLIVSPELGIHAPHSGFPKDLVHKVEVSARGSKQEELRSLLPPSMLNLPSHLAPDFNRRYHGFLNRFHAFLADVRRAAPQAFDSLSIILGGGLWKYYRSPGTLDPVFPENSGDYGKLAAAQYCKVVEEFFQQKEFMERTQGAKASQSSRSGPERSADRNSERWRLKAFDKVNRQWFNSQSEEVSRIRSHQILSKNGLPLKIQKAEIYTPEADPVFNTRRFYEILTGLKPDVQEYSRCLDAFAMRLTGVSGEFHLPLLHWTGFGPFQRFSAQERQFLLVKSLLLMGGSGGCILLSHEDWLGLSAKARGRLSTLSRAIVSNKLNLKTRVFYWTPDTWSHPGLLWEELFSAIGTQARIVSNLSLITQDQDAYMVIVDPKTIITAESVRKLFDWAKEGRIVVLPQSPLFTEAAKFEIERQVRSSSTLELNIGVRYQLAQVGVGKVALFELPDGFDLRAGARTVWTSFLNSVLGLAQIQWTCRFSDSRLQAMTLVRKTGGGQQLAIFVLNKSGAPVSADIIFPVSVRLNDLLSSMNHDDEVSRFEGQKASEKEDMASTRFSIEVPACGILPFGVSGLVDLRDEQHQATIIAHETRVGVASVVNAELPGFEGEEAFPWT